VVNELDLTVTACGFDPVAGVLTPLQSLSTLPDCGSDREGFSTAEIWKQWEAMKQGLGWVHVKDYRKVGGAVRGRHVDEGGLTNFVPADRGVGGHARIFADLVTFLPTLSKRLQRRGIPGVFLDLEPHVRGGGQFGGTSGPDGMGIALRGLCSVLDGAGVDYHLRDFDDLLAARGLS
jgi:hypothetical protein